MVVGPPALNLDLGYISVTSDSIEDEFDDREELNWILRSQVSRYWTIYGGQRVDLGQDQTRQIRIGAIYQDECFLIQGVVQRNFFEDREIKPEDVFFVSIVFKNLGGLASNEAGAF